MSMRNNEFNDRRTEQFRKLFVGGLTPAMDESALKDYYGQWGDIVDVVVMKDNKTDRSRGFGFVTYKEAEMVDEAQNNRPHEIDGKVVEAKRAMPREESSNPESHMPVQKLFVGGLKKDVTSQDLQQYFSSYGNIKECEVVTWKESGESRGFGFVTFDDYDPVDKAILYKPHHIESSRADVKKALSKDQMRDIEMKKQNQDNYGNNQGSGMRGGGMGGGYGGGFGGGFGNNQMGNMGMGGGMGGGGFNNNMGGGWNQGGRMGNQGGRMGNQGGQMRNQGGQMGNQGGRMGNQGGQMGNQGGQMRNQGGQMGNQGGQMGNQGGQMGNQGGRMGNQGGWGKMEGGMGDGFGNYGNQNLGGGPIRGGGQNNQRNNPYGGGYGRR